MIYSKISKPKYKPNYDQPLPDHKALQYRENQYEKIDEKYIPNSCLKNYSPTSQNRTKKKEPNVEKVNLPNYPPKSKF